MGKRKVFNRTDLSVPGSSTLAMRQVALSFFPRHFRQIQLGLLSVATQRPPVPSTSRDGTAPALIQSPTPASARSSVSLQVRTDGLRPVARRVSAKVVYATFSTI